MQNNFCLVVFSHSDSTQKNQILIRNLISLRNLKLPIILVSHIPVETEIQNLCDYYIKDSDNLILDEGQIYSSPVEINHPLYYVYDSFGGKNFATNNFKKTYQPGVFNLYINSFRFAKDLGFENAILWEFDFSLGPVSESFILNSIENFNNNNLDFLSFNSYIQNLNCLHAVPSFLKLSKVISALPKTPIKKASDYTQNSKMMIMEQWTAHHFWSKESKTEKIDYSKIGSLLPDLVKGEVDSQKGNFLFFDLRSGIYFDEKDSVIISGINSSDTNLKTQFTIKDNKTDLILFDMFWEINKNHWFYQPITSVISDKMKSEPGVEITETLTNLENGEKYDFRFTISEINYDFISKLKRYRSEE